MSEVWVTGLGAVSACGWGRGALATGLAAGQTAIGPLRRVDASRQRTQIAGEVPAAASTQPDFGRPAPRAASWADRFAIFAAREAVADAGLADAGVAGLYFASSTGGMFETEQLYAARRNGRRADLRSLGSQETSGPAESVARALGIRGPVETISSACSSGGLAILAALDALRAGDLEVAIAGGADSLCALTYSGFNALRAVDARPCRPFRADRAGMSIGEGAAALVLESSAHARARGARPWATLLGAGSSCDARHMTAPDESGKGPARAIVAALDDAAVAPAAIGLINAHGTGTRQNDAAEARALVLALGEQAGRIPLTATKATVGHLLGCAGSLEAVATVLALASGMVPPTAAPKEAGTAPKEAGTAPNEAGTTLKEAAPKEAGTATNEAGTGLGVDLVVGAARPLTAPCGLSVSLAFGGANVALVFGRCP